MINADAVIAMLDAADRGEVPVRLLAEDTWERVGDGNVAYELGNGWRIAVFDDVGEWRYLDAVQPPGQPWVDLWDNLELWPDEPRAADHPDERRKQAIYWHPRQPKVWSWDGPESPTGFRRG